MGIFVNTTETIGVVLEHGTLNTTGSLFLTLLIIILIIMALAMMFQIQLEFTAILILPLIISYMAYFSEWVATGSILLIYLAFLITKNFIFK